MTFIPVDEKELRAATYASLRAHPISKQAEALVSTLAGMLEDHALATGARKNERKDTAEKFYYVIGAFLADLLRTYGDDEPAPNPWVYHSMHAKSFTGASVSFRTFASLVDGLKQLGLLQHVDGHDVSSEPEDRSKFAARFRATPALLSFCTEHSVEPTKVHDHFEFEFDLPKCALRGMATGESD
jgi:hypothetical protein